MIKFMRLMKYRLNGAMKDPLIEIYLLPNFITI